MELLTVILLGVVLALVYHFYQNTYKYWERRGVPFEPPVPILGNMRGVGYKYHFRDINQRLYDRFKGTTPFGGIFTFLRRVAFIVDLDLVKQVLIKDFTLFQDRVTFSNVRDDPLTGHLFSLEGEEWRSMRHKLTPVFKSGKMKHMVGIVVDVGKRLAETMDKAVVGSSSEVEIKELCACFTTDVIGTCAFGLECNSLADPNAKFRANGRQLFEKPRHNQFVQAFIFSNVKLARMLRMKTFPDDVSEFFMQAVRDTVDHRKQHNIKRNDLLDQLIELRAENEEAARLGKGIDLSHGLTIEQMAAQAFIFFIASFENSANAMAFFLYELALHQDMQERVRQEIETVLKETSNGEQLTFDAMQNMPYLDQVLAETLRKYPIVPHLTRVANKDYKVDGTQLVIEKDTMVLIPVHSIHHDPQIYPSPETFDPSRFEPEAIKARHQYAYLPFGDGPRNCIGERFGKMQAKIGLVTLLRSFKFGVSKKTDVPLIFSTHNFTLRPQAGIHLKVERI
ncbi:GH21098 [Drosophila grimshawi]|nr:GH21098 [Drosophila grimshawi]